MKNKKCECGEEFDSDGNNLKIPVCMCGCGNNYQYRSSDKGVIKYTRCNLCGKEVILDEYLRLINRKEIQGGNGKNG
jgi:hypothetical protein